MVKYFHIDIRVNFAGRKVTHTIFVKSNLVIYTNDLKNVLDPVILILINSPKKIIPNLQNASYADVYCSTVVAAAAKSL